MASAVWAALGLAALIWPSRLAGAFDGAPFDSPLEAIGLAATIIAVWLRPTLLQARVTRALIVALLVVHAVISWSASMDGWCLRFTTPAPIYLEQTRVPHSWDVRADWQSPVPRCSAILRRDYSTLEEFPVWFYNLPPVHQGTPAVKTDRPPFVELQMDATGFMRPSSAGVLRIEGGEDTSLDLELDGRAFTQSELVAGVPVTEGVHAVHARGRMVRSQWSLRMFWNDRPFWRSVMATTTPPTWLDGWVRTVGAQLPALLVLAFLVMAGANIASRAGDSRLLVGLAVTCAATAALPLLGSPAITRFASLLLFVGLFAPVPARMRNGFGASLLVGAPFLAIFLSVGIPQVGVFTWFSSGDDWWMFQRYAYRIFLQGYWLEAGQQTFWFQPLYRYINGALHMVFGDSSVGELWWDAACLGFGAFFTFTVVRRFAGFRWALGAAALTLAIMMLGPAWYLIGRGLSEISSMGFIYGAALAAIRARRGDGVAMVVTGLCCALAFYTRLNNLPVVCAVAVCALPIRQPVSSIWRPATWVRASRPALVAILGGLASALWLFTLRTYHYTGMLDMFFGTQAGHLAVWSAGKPVSENVSNILGSLAMVITMTDPPTLDVRAVPIVLGILAATLGVLGVPRLRALPLNASALVLSGVTGALVARGTAYPGRFSLHLIPGAVTLFVCATYFAVSGLRTRGRRPVHPQPGTM